jgi:hypothetical protein
MTGLMTPIELKSIMPAAFSGGEAAGLAYMEYCAIWV